MRRLANGGDGLGIIALWVIAIFALTAVGIAPLYLYGLDVRHLSPQQISPLVGVGIELTAYAPSLAALLVAGLAHNTAGIRPLLALLARWRAHIGWYAAALMGPLVIFLVANLIRLALGSWPPAEWIRLPSGFALAFAIGSIIAGSLGEEIGWRGFGQTRLQRRFGALAASLMIGTIWTVWHYWGLFAPGGLPDFTLIGFAISVLRMCSLSVLYAWLFNGSRLSLPVAMAAHAGHNIANNVVQSGSGGIDLGEIVIVLYALTAIAVVGLTRLRLGKR